MQFPGQVQARHVISMVHLVCLHGALGANFFPHICGNVDIGTTQYLITLAHFFLVLEVGTKKQITIPPLQLITQVGLGADMALCGLLLTPNRKSVSNDTIQQLFHLPTLAWSSRLFEVDTGS